MTDVALSLNEQLTANLTEMQLSLRTWLFDKALPLWWDIGGDRVKGGFFEKLNLDGTPHDINRRTRVAARQVYSYALAKTMGYSGDCDGPIDQGLQWLGGPARNPETELLYAVLSPAGKPVRAEFDFYDHAFAMLAYASAFRVRPQDKALEQAGIFIRDAIIGTYSHPERGFEEAVPRTLPLKANPHMHMFEACLAWMEAGGDGNWQASAQMIADLCLDKFLDPKSGALREFFDGEWSVASGESGRILEPGHQFEWAWLFLRWSDKTGQQKYADAAHRLMDIGEVAGTDPLRDATFNELWDDLTPKDLNARLWPQTERTKAWVRTAEMAPDQASKAAAIAKAIQAAAGLKLYLSTEMVGLWHDRMKADGSFEVEPAPASSLYHIICAIDELSRLKV